MLQMFQVNLPFPPEQLLLQHTAEHHRADRLMASLAKPGVRVLHCAAYVQLVASEQAVLPSFIGRVYAAVQNRVLVLDLLLYDDEPASAATTQTALLAQTADKPAGVLSTSLVEPTMRTAKFRTRVPISVWPPPLAATSSAASGAGPLFFPGIERERARILSQGTNSRKHMVDAFCFCVACRHLANGHSALDCTGEFGAAVDRKSTRLNSSHT